MKMKCEITGLVDGCFMVSRSELTSALETAEAMEKLAPKGVVFGDKMVFREGEFHLHWKEARGGAEIDGDRRRTIEADILRGLTMMQVRRQEAKRNNEPIVEQTHDPKNVRLNQALHNAKANNVEVMPSAPDAEPIRSVDPLSLLLLTPRPDPRDIDVDEVVTGSNVVGGDVQLSLFNASMVDVVFFVRGATFTEIRVSVPIGKAHVRNLVTRIRVTGTQARPEDTFLTAKDAPFLYMIKDGKEVPYDE
jgi:hypothetical protein